MKQAVEPLPSATIQVVSTAAECKGIVPSVVPKAVKYSRKFSEVETWCRPGTSDGTGHVALGQYKYWGNEYAYQDAEAQGRLQHFFYAPGLTPLIPQEKGFHSITYYRVEGGSDRLDHKAISPTGVTTRTTPILPESGRRMWGSAASVDPLGGSVVAVLSHVDVRPWGDIKLLVQRFRPDGSPRSAPVDALGQLPREMAGPTGYTVAVSTKGPSLVAWRGSSGAWLRWVGPDGAFLTEPFQDVAMPGAVNLQPLLDGTVAAWDGGAWVRQYSPGSTTGSAAPAWLTSRKSTTIFFTRGAKGYAVMAPANDTGCAWQIELLAGNGKLCGTVTLNEGPASCTSESSVQQGWDGTVVLQSGRETCDPTCTCTHVWWPRLLAKP